MKVTLHYSKVVTNDCIPNKQSDLSIVRHSFTIVLMATFQPSARAVFSIKILSKRKLKGVKTQQLLTAQ